MIVVGVPSVRDVVSWRTAESIIGLRMPEPWLFRREAGYGGVDVACNALAQRVLQDGHDWLVIVGDDAVLHPNTVERLVGWGEPVVAALSFMRYGPFAPTVFRDNNAGALWLELDGVREWLRAHPEVMQRNGPVVLNPRPEDALLSVDAAGSHCMAIHRSILASVEPPWFGRNSNEDTKGEDLNFCRAVRAAGWPIYVDRSVVAGHLAGDWCLGALDFAAWDNVTAWDWEGEKKGALMQMVRRGRG